MSSRDAVLTPTQLNTLARNLLEDSFPAVWVEGELGNVTRPSSGHLYFTLKDAGAQVRAAMFKMRASTLRFAPREGLRVLLRGKLTLYAPRGDYQLVVEHMEQAGEGALRQAFEQLRARLQAEGLFDPAHKKPLPLHPTRLAVITSPTGAAVRDVLSVLSRRYPLLQVDLLPSLVQGDTAAPQITRLLRSADASQRYSAILLTRGGGSLEDLWAFNDEALTRAVAACSTPVISAIGHETDFSLTDFAADLRAPTPSAAAELLVPDQADLRARLRQFGRGLWQAQRRSMEQASQRSDQAWLRLQRHSPQQHLRLLGQRQATLHSRLQAQWQHQQHLRQRRLDQLQARLQWLHPARRLDALAQRQQLLGQRLQRAIQARLENEQQHLAPLQLRLAGQHPRQRLDRASAQLASLARSLHLASPLATVSRGYALATDSNGQLLRSVHQVLPGQTVQLQLADGHLQAEVTAIAPAPAATDGKP
jgi:exodeoxyribonuclease VII large subunit